MPKVILICGKICCGKTTYAERLRAELRAVMLSADEITLAVFGQHIGEKHDEYCENVREYLFRKSLELIEIGVDVILDWGFWKKGNRDYAKEFYRSRNISCELHYLDVSDSLWKKRIEKRNAMISRGELSAYYVDEALAEKFAAAFEKPSRDEADVWVETL